MIMIMLMPCEVVIKEFLPAMRASVTKILSEKYSFTQMDIASQLGLTQAAVSKYLSGDYSNEIKIVQKVSDVQKMAEKTAHMIAEKKASKIQVVNSLCGSCQSFFGDKWTCEIRGLAESLMAVQKK